MKSPTICFAIALLCSQSALTQLQPVYEWSSTYSGPVNGIDLPNAAFLDRYGNYYLAGRSEGGSTNQDAAIVRFSPSGEETLELRYNATANLWDEAIDVSVDDSGNVLVPCWSTRPDRKRNLVLTKYSAFGEVLWQCHFPSDTAGIQSVSNIAHDLAGNILVAADCSGRMILLRFTHTGELIDTIRIGDQSSVHHAIKICVADDGSIFLAGVRYWLPSGDDSSASICILAKVDSTGAVEWIRSLESWGTPVIRADLQNNIVVATSVDVLRAKYSSEGQLLWSDKDQSADPLFGAITDLAIDSQNGIVFGGYRYHTDSHYDFVVAWYDGEGSLRQARSYNSADSTEDFCEALTLDRFDNVYLTGRNSTVSLVRKCITMKYDPTGSLQWETSFAYGSNLNAGGASVIVDESGFVYIGGHTYCQNGADYLAIKYRQEPPDEVDFRDSDVKSRYALSQNYPNPFNPRTTIRYTLASPGFVSLKVYGVLGNEVARLVQSHQEAGTHNVEFDASSLPSGIYFYRLQAGAFVDIKRCALVK